MSLENTWRQLQTLPPEKQQEVGDFVEFLSERQHCSQGVPKAAQKSFTDGPYFGMWRDREEMKDSAQWVRQLREKEWGS